MSRNLTTAKPDLKGLYKFATKTGRVDPPSFVGRGEFIREFQEDVCTRTEEWYDGKPAPWEGGSWLFQGAPGAGKTALLRELKKITVPNSIGRPVNPDVCMLKKKVLNSDTKLESELLSLFPGNWLGDLIREIGLKISLFGGGAEISAENQAATKAWRRKVKKAMNNPGAFRPLLVMIDEAQNISDKAKDQVEWLQEGTHGLPILPVFGGLAWTRKRFKKLGLSRIDGNRAITLEALPEEDRREAVHRFFEKYRIVASPKATAEWAQAIADDCRGWPQHLHFSLQGMALALIAPGVDGNLDRADLEKSRQYAEEQRNDYYSDRLDSKELERKDILVAHGAKACNPDRTTTPFALARVIHEASEKAGGAGTMSASALPEGMSATQFVDVMERAGILHEYRPVSKTTGKPLPLQVKIPIPSFRTYLLDILESPTEPEDQHDQNLAPSPGF